MGFIPCQTSISAASLQAVPQRGTSGLTSGSRVADGLKYRGSAASGLTSGSSVADGLMYRSSAATQSS